MLTLLKENTRQSPNENMMTQQHGNQEKEYRANMYL
jgi:hypothetical protein